MVIHHLVNQIKVYRVFNSRSPELTGPKRCRCDARLSPDLACARLRLAAINWNRPRQFRGGTRHLEQAPHRVPEMRVFSSKRSRECPEIAEGLRSAKNKRRRAAAFRSSIEGYQLSDVASPARACHSSDVVWLVARFFPYQV
jgi:hypothetical protein